MAEKPQTRTKSPGKKRIWWELDRDVVRLVKLENVDTDQGHGAIASRRLRESYRRDPVATHSN